MRKIVVIIAALILSISIKAQTEYIAHRGASYLAPENTLASVNLAWELGADAVEVDIHLSEDNRVMVIHDQNTRRTSGKAHVIKSTNSEELRKLDVGTFKSTKYKGEKIPFLEEVIATVPEGKKLVVELKSGKETIPALKKLVEDCKKQDQLSFICFNWDVIIGLKKTFPNNSCYWLSGNRSKILKKIDQISQFNLDGIDINYSVVDEKLMKKAKEAKLDVWVYTVDQVKKTKRLIGLGVKGITTNRSNWLKQNVEKQTDL